MLAVCWLSRPAAAETGEKPVGSATPAAANGRLLSDEAELDRIVGLYLSGQYEKCVEILGPLIQSSRGGGFADPKVLERGRLYFASCAVLSGRSEPARVSLRAALEANPLMSPPDSLTFPPPVLALFFEVREEVQSLIAKEEQAQGARLRRENEEARRRAADRDKREKELLRMATEQPVIAKSSRFVASLPFGAGQYQNGNESLGHVFLISEAALTGATALSAGLLLSLYSQAASTPQNRVGIPAADYDKFAAASTVLTLSAFGTLTLAGLGIFEAHMSFQDERQLGVRKRALPQSLEAADAAEEPSDEAPTGNGSSTAEPSSSAPSQPIRRSGTVAPFSFPIEQGFLAGVSGTF